MVAPATVVCVARWARPTQQLSPTSVTRWSIQVNALTSGCLIATNARHTVPTAVRRREVHSADERPLE